MSNIFELMIHKTTSTEIVVEFDPHSHSIQEFAVNICMSYKNAYDSMLKCIEKTQRRTGIRNGTLVTTVTRFRGENEEAKEILRKAKQMGCDWAQKEEFPSCTGSPTTTEYTYNDDGTVDEETLKPV